MIHTWEKKTKAWDKREKEKMITEQEETQRKLRVRDVTLIKKDIRQPHVLNGTNSKKKMWKSERVDFIVREEDKWRIMGRIARAEENM